MQSNQQSGQSSKKTDTFADLVRFVVFIVVFCMPFTMDKTEYQRNVEVEIFNTVSVMPKSARMPVLKASHDIYQKVMFDSKLYGFMSTSLLIDQSRKQDKFEQVWNKFMIISHRIVENTPILLYQIAFRFVSSLSWLLFLIPFALASVYAGMQYWKLSSYTAINVKIERYKLYRKGLYLTGWFYLIYLVVPLLGFATLSQLVAPMAIIVLSLVVNQLIKSYHSMV